jgi:hypothetical protein
MVALTPPDKDAPWTQRYIQCWSPNSHRPGGEQTSPARAAAERGGLPSNPPPDHGRTPHTGPEEPPIAGLRPKPETMAQPATRTKHLTSGRAGETVPGEAHAVRIARTTDRVQFDKPADQWNAFGSQKREIKLPGTPLDFARHQ